MSKGSKALGIITGRMGTDVIVRETSNGKKIGTLRLATVDGFGDNELTSWFDVVVFDQKKVEILEKYTGKGSRVMAIGTLRVRKWKDRDGNDRYTTELVVSFDGSIELMDSKDEAQKLGNVRDDKPKARPQSAFDSDLDDDVPF
jgi:single-strand DNA-binding protein